MAVHTAPTAISGIEFQSADTQALQRDAFANPGMLWVDKGALLWQQRSGEKPACRQCHGGETSPGDQIQTMRGVAPRYPKVNKAGTGLMSLQQKINQCRVQRQGQPAWPDEHEALLSLSAYVTHQSAGLAFDVTIDGLAAPFFAKGQTYYRTRRGQMNLACYHCHQQNVGNMLRGDKLSQGQSNGYPTYRLQWQGLGSLHRRLQFCNSGIRAEPLPIGSADYLNLELYLAWRAQSLPLESPAVRR